MAPVVATTAWADEDSAHLSASLDLSFSWALTVEGNTAELKRGVTIERTTFVIGKDGKILYQAKGNIANDPKLLSCSDRD